MWEFNYGSGFGSARPAALPIRSPRASPRNAPLSSSSARIDWRGTPLGCAERPAYARPACSLRRSHPGTPSRPGRAFFLAGGGSPRLRRIIRGHARLLCPRGKRRDPRVRRAHHDENDLQQGGFLGKSGWRDRCPCCGVRRDQPIRQVPKLKKLIATNRIEFAAIAAAGTALLLAEHFLDDPANPLRWHAAIVWTILAFMSLVTWSGIVRRS